MGVGVAVAVGVRVGSGGMVDVLVGNTTADGGTTVTGGVGWFASGTGDASAGGAAGATCWLTGGMPGSGAPGSPSGGATFSGAAGASGATAPPGCGGDTDPPGGGLIGTMPVAPPLATGTGVALPAPRPACTAPPVPVVAVAASGSDVAVAGAATLGAVGGRAVAVNPSVAITTTSGVAAELVAGTGVDSPVATGGTTRAGPGKATGPTSRDGANKELLQAAVTTPAPIPINPPIKQKRKI